MVPGGSPKQAKLKFEGAKSIPWYAVGPAMADDDPLPAPRVTRVMETCLYAEDLDAAQSFYGDVLGLRVLTREGDRHVFFVVGPSMLLIFNPEATRAEEELGPHGVAPGGPGQHYALEVDDLDAWRDRLADRGVAVEQEVTWPSGARSIYFRDPAGNLGELVEPGLWPVEGR